MGSQSHEVSILLLDDTQITGLNQEYLKREGPTDVISFPMRDDDFPEVQPEVLGDVVISVETALRRAEARNIPLYEEVLFLLIHGILHLLGYDHEQSTREEKKMRRREAELFEQVITDPKIRSAVDTV